MKFEIFKKLVLEGKVYGKVKAFAYSIELQQRGSYHQSLLIIRSMTLGMPHAHILIILENKLDSPEKIDKHVWVSYLFSCFLSHCFSRLTFRIPMQRQIQ